MPVEIPEKKSRAQLTAEHHDQMSKLTEDELKAQQDEFLGGFGYKPKRSKDKAEKAEETPKPEEKKKEETETAPAPAQKQEADADGKKEDAAPAPAPAPAPKAEEPKTEQRKPIPQAEEDDDLAERISERVTSKLKPAPAPAQDAPKDEFDDEDKAVLQAVAVLQKDPRFKGKNLAKETTDFWKKEDDYATKWEEEHPGEKFDATAEEHRDFYARIRPSYDTGDLSKAQEELRTQEIERRAEERAIRRVQPQIDEIKLERAVQAAAPKIMESRDDAITALMTTAVPEFEAIIKEHGRGEEGLAKLEETNPIAMELLDEEAGALKVRVEELEKLNHLGNMHKPDPDLAVELDSGTTVMPYRDILKAGTALEERIRQQNPSEQIYEGRKFITRAEMTNRVRSINESHASKEEKQAKIDRLLDGSWFIELSDIKDYLVHQSAAKVKKMLARINNGKPANSSSSAVRDTAGKASEAKTTAKPAATPPPSVAAVSTTVNTQLKGQQADVSDAQILAKMRGR